MAQIKTRLLARMGATRIYRTSLSASPHLRYLNVAALRRARKLDLPMGSVTIHQHTVNIIAVITHGAVTEFRLANCTGCDTAGALRRNARQRKTLARAVHDKFETLGLHSTPLPMPVARLASPRFQLSIDIVLTPEGMICIRIESTDGYGCLICPDGITCFRPSVPPVG